MGKDQAVECVSAYLAERSSRVSPRQLEVWLMHKRGESIQEIADTLNIGYETVRSHLRELKGKARAHAHRKSQTASPA